MPNFRSHEIFKKNRGHPDLHMYKDKRKGLRILSCHGTVPTPWKKSARHSRIFFETFGGLGPMASYMGWSSQVQETAGLNYHCGSVWHKMHIGEAAKAVRHDPDHVLANATSPAQTVVEYHLAFIHNMLAVQCCIFSVNNDVWSEDFRSQQFGGLWKVGRLRVFVCIEQTLAPNPAV